MSKHVKDLKEYHAHSINVSHTPKMAFPDGTVVGRNFPPMQNPGDVGLNLDQKAPLEGNGFTF